MQTPTPRSFFDSHAVWNVARSMVWNFVLIPTERATFQTAWLSKKLRGICVCIHATYGNAASRMAEFVPSDGSFSRGADPDVDVLYKQQARETDRKKPHAMLSHIQQLLHERVRVGPMWRYI